MKLNTMKPASKNHTSKVIQSSYRAVADRVDGEIDQQIVRSKGSLKSRADDSTQSSIERDIAPTAEVLHRDQITVRTPQIDKIIAVLFSEVVSTPEQESIVERLRSQLRIRQLVRGTAKGEPFSRVFIQRLPSGAVAKFAVEPTRDHVKQFLQITLNPNLMTVDDVQAFADMITRVFGPQWTRRMKSLKYARIDTCVDVVGVVVNDLIILFEGARSHAVFFIQTGRDGTIQTYYVGSVQSQTHGCVYDQIASDEHKVRVGEKVQPVVELQRVKVRDDAEVAITNYAAKGRTRFEVRNVLKTPLTVGDLASMESAMHRFTVYHVRKTRGVKFDTPFLSYIDSVRQRGVNGARAYLTASASKKAKARIQEREELLTKLLAPWWDPDQYVLDVRAVLKLHGLWTVLCPGDGKASLPGLPSKDRTDTKGQQ